MEGTVSPRSRSIASLRSPERSQAGVGLLEVMVALALGLIVLIAAYDFLEKSNRTVMKQGGLADAQNTGRAALDLFVSELRNAGYSPMGYPYHAIAEGTASRVRIVADLDGDAAIGVSGETDEKLSYVFQGPDSTGLYKLVRGVDFNEDWVFTGSGESLMTVATHIVPIDFDRDGIDDPFVAYDIAPPASTIAYDPATPAVSRVTVTFGVRSGSRDLLSRSYPVVNFHSDIALRNRTY